MHRPRACSAQGMSAQENFAWPQSWPRQYRPRACIGPGHVGSGPGGVRGGRSRTQLLRTVLLSGPRVQHCRWGVHVLGSTANMHGDVCIFNGRSKHGKHEKMQDQEPFDLDERVRQLLEAMETRREKTKRLKWELALASMSAGDAELPAKAGVGSAASASVTGGVGGVSSLALVSMSAGDAELPGWQRSFRIGHGRVGSSSDIGAGIRRFFVVQQLTGPKGPSPSPELPAKAGVGSAASASVTGGVGGVSSSDIGAASLVCRLHRIKSSSSTFITIETTTPQHKLHAGSISKTRCRHSSRLQQALIHTSSMQASF